MKKLWFVYATEPGSDIVVRRFLVQADCQKLAIVEIGKLDNSDEWELSGEPAKFDRNVIVL